MQMESSLLCLVVYWLFHRIWQVCGFVLCWCFCLLCLVGLLWVGVWFYLVVTYGLLACNSSLLLASQSADGHVYAVIHSCSPICNMQLNVLNDLAEAMKALDGKK